MFPKLPESEQKELLDFIMQVQYHTAVVRSMIIGVVLLIAFIALLVWIL